VAEHLLKWLSQYQMQAEMMVVALRNRYLHPIDADICSHLISPETALVLTLQK